MKAKVGDDIIVEPMHVGGHKRVAHVLQVLGEQGHEHYRVRWEDEHESIYFPGPDAMSVKVREHRAGAK